VTLVDVEGIVSMDVPTAWADTDVESFWQYGDDLVGVSITAAADIAAWTSGWDTPGVFFAASTALTATESVRSLLDGQDYSFACQYDGRYDYADALYNGAYDLWVDCDGRDTLFVVLAAETPASDVLMMLQIVVVTDADLEALDAILASFVVDEVALAEFSGTTTTGDSFGVYDFADLFTGECFNLVGGEVADIQYGVEVEVVDCGGPHAGEVYGNYFIPDADSIAWPGEESLSESAEEFCFAEFEGYVGSTYAESSLDYWLYWPTQSGWDGGRGFLMCALFDSAGGDLTGSAWQSGW
jgi:hypothetical protein